MCIRDSYWCIPGANRTARCGKWVQGPSSALVDAIKTAYPHIDFIAEDLGFLTPEVLKLVEYSGFPDVYKRQLWKTKPMEWLR